MLLFFVKKLSQEMIREFSFNCKVTVAIEDVIRRSFVAYFLRFLRYGVLESFGFLEKKPPFAEKRFRC